MMPPLREPRLHVLSPSFLRYADLNDDPHQHALDGRNGDYTKLQLIRMNEKFAKAMARAGHGRLVYAAGDIHSDCAA